MKTKMICTLLTTVMVLSLLPVAVREMEQLRRKVR